MSPSINVLLLLRLFFFLSPSLKAKIETRALKAKRPGFSEERYNETEYYFENGKSMLLLLLLWLLEVVAIDILGKGKERGKSY